MAFWQLLSMLGGLIALGLLLVAAHDAVEAWWRG